MQASHGGPKVKLKRTLTPAKMQMIALGGAIGVGLFMGSASTIQWTGPSVLLDYAIAGFVIYLVMRALGEMLYVHPVTGSFADFANYYMHPIFGYLTAWSNIFEWIITGTSEVIAMGTYCHYWWPSLPRWVPGLIAIVFLCSVNMISVKSYGNFEYWFSMIKVVTIILMIIAGLGVIIFGFGNGMHPVGVSNLWSHGFFGHGLKGFLFAFAVVIASYQGVEFIGITAGEAEDPQHSIVKAVQSTIWRIMIFYVGSIFVIVSIFPWNQLDAQQSPFVETFSKIGITIAAGVINFVVLTAALSGCNSGIYSTSRMTFNLASKHELPKSFTKINHNGVPYIAVLAVSIGIFLGLVLNIILPFFIKSSGKIFVMVYSAGILPGMVPWIVILISQMRFRKIEPQSLHNHPFKMPWSPFSNYGALAILFATLIVMMFNPDTQIPLLIGVIFLATFTFIYIIRHNKWRLINKKWFMNHFKWMHLKKSHHYSRDYLRYLS
ncbi:amino acid permease [Acetilactobacillus jinshanensis]|nr:amino acid permease [Acetilactobacillus jinshanensis]